MCKTHLSNKRDVFVTVGVLDINQPLQVIPCQNVHPVLIFVPFAKSARLNHTDYIKVTDEL